MNFCLWRMALRQVAPAGGIQDRLGRLTHSGYKVWNWRYDLENGRLLHAVDKKTDVYTPSNLSRMIGTANRWTRSLIGQDIEPMGQVCTVRDVCTTVKSVVSVAEPPQPEEMPQCLEEVLESWGSTWMCKLLRLIGDNGWLNRAIVRGTLVAVTDRSYMRELLPNLCSAAFILEYSEGNGRIIGSFAEASRGANAYRGELIHP